MMSNDSLVMNDLISKRRRNRFQKFQILCFTSRRPSCTVGPFTSRMSVSRAVLVAACARPSRAKVTLTFPIVKKINSVLIRSKIYFCARNLPAIYELFEN